jgi:HNH endonuclease
VSWQIRIPFRDRDEPLDADALTDLPAALEGEDRDVTRELMVQARLEGARTVGDVLDRVEAVGPRGRRQLLDEARTALGLPTTGRQPLAPFVGVVGLGHQRQSPTAERRHRERLHQQCLPRFPGSAPRTHHCGGPVEWGRDLEVDHLNRDRRDNRLANLAPACRSCQNGNREPWGQVFCAGTLDRCRSQPEPTPDRRRAGRAVAGEALLHLRQDRSGEIPRVPLPGRYYRYRLDVIEQFERGELQSNHNQKKVA